MTNVLNGYSTRLREYDMAAPGQVANHTGGMTHVVSDEQRLRRFLILGSTGGTFYVNAKDLTRENGDLIVTLAEAGSESHAMLRETILDVSERGAAPKVDPALFALAIACSHGEPADRSAALELLPRIARTGSHLTQFTTYVTQFRGWGRSLRRAVADWYTSKTAEQIAYQSVKYRTRNGKTPYDMLRLSHARGDASQQAVFDWILSGSHEGDLPAIIDGYERAQQEGADVPALVREFGLSHEMLPDAAKTDPRTWDALLDAGLPMTALVRNLPTLTRLGLLGDLDERTERVVAQITDRERLRRARVHPMELLKAQRSYASGRASRGDNTWVPTRAVVDGLDEAFYAAFESVVPTGKRLELDIDVSPSMSWHTIAGLPLTARDASAAMALVTMASEKRVAVRGFSHRMVDMAISPRMRLDDVLRVIDSTPMGSTDISQPILSALNERREVDAFVVYTDNETNGGYNVADILARYREVMGLDTKLIVVGMAATHCSVANPADPGMLDVAGFDTSTPAAISEFIRG